MKFVERKVTWKKQDVHEYGGDMEYAGSFEKPDFINIQRGSASEPKKHDRFDNPPHCVIAQHRETGHWYWFREDDTLLPWGDPKFDGFTEVHSEGEVRSLPAREIGPFATEEAAKNFGASYIREQTFTKEQQRKAQQKFDKAKETLADLLKTS